ncbi:MAG: tetratricopeptide repeat protein, partial [Deltaproteobacteria bacterium]|nr:tetratricopeptide repeat protein [Deltaproteobacteria bacterium]
RDYGKSAELLRRVLEKHPGRIRAGVYLAETLLADGKAAEAKQVLDAALAQPPVGDPPEDRRALSWGRALEPKIRAALK